MRGQAEAAKSVCRAADVETAGSGVDGARIPLKFERLREAGRQPARRAE